MKTKLSFILLVICLSLMGGCSEYFMENGKSNLKIVPFKADFTVYNHSDITDRSCGDMPIFFLTMQGEGNITQMGKITTTMTFCNNMDDGSYWGTTGWFVAANGDTLFFEIPEGQILPNDESNSDYYQAKFNDPMYFTGGTGKYEGASGMAMTKAYVHDVPEEWHTDFFSTGKLILVKNKKK